MSDERVVRQLLEKIAVECNYKNYELTLSPFSTDGANYTTHLYKATISEANAELHIFAKIAALGEKLRSQMPVHLYDNEILFYTKLAKIFLQLEQRKDIPEEHRLRVPAFYGCNSKVYEETIVLENLTETGYSSFDRFKTVTWEYAAAAITVLAKFHALSVLYQQENPGEFEEVLAMTKFKGTDKDQLQPVWASITSKTINMTKEENKPKLKEFLESNFTGRDTFEKLFAPRKLAVISHGDYRPSNLMHKENKDGTYEIIPVDYQTLRGGCPVVDLLYFIFTGTDQQFRALHYQRLVDHYYSELRAALARLGLDLDDKYPREHFDYELQEKLPFGLGVAIFTLPMLTVEAENAPKVDNDFELNDFFIEKTGSLYPERLNGIVDDFVRWGII